MLHEYTVIYHLTEGQHGRLKALTERFNRTMGAENTPEGLFEGMMTMGVYQIINERMDDLDGALAGVEAHMEEGNCRECTV